MDSDPRAIRSRPSMSSRYRLYLEKKKTLDTKISPDTVVVQNERKNLEEERETDREVCVWWGWGGQAQVRAL